MRPSSLGGGRILRRTVCPSVCPSVPLLFLFILFYSRTVLRANIQNRKPLFSLMGQRLFGTQRGPHLFTYLFTAISAAQILVIIKFSTVCIILFRIQLPLGPHFWRRRSTPARASRRSIACELPRPQQQRRQQHVYYALSVSFIPPTGRTEQLPRTAPGSRDSKLSVSSSASFGVATVVRPLTAAACQ